MASITSGFVDKNPAPGKYYDLYGLFLRVETTGRRYWEQRYTLRGKRRDIGIGAYPAVRLSEARKKALKNLQLIADGEDPAAQRDRPAVPTLEAAVPQVIELHAVRWTNSRQATIWQRSFETHIFPSLGDKCVSEITSVDLLEVLTPIWNTRNDTARRLRQRLSIIMKWAIVQRYRTDNPAEVALGALPTSSGSSEHYQALPHAEVSAALALVRACPALLATRLAFEFLVLTATRSGEVRGARWGEVDFDNALWSVPASRMKSRTLHRVPLSGPALAVLCAARERLSAADLVFPSPRGKALSDSTISALVRTLKINAVPHGFRSSFRDWCAESGVDREVAEACLAHVVANKVEAAYRRSDILKRRVPVMEDWAQYVTAEIGPCVLADGPPASRS